MQIHQGTHGRAGDGDYIRPYHCNVLGCGKSFTEKRNLNAHRRTRHTEVSLDSERTRLRTEGDLGQLLGAVPSFGGRGRGELVARLFDACVLTPFSL